MIALYDVTAGFYWARHKCDSTGIGGTFPVHVWRNDPRDSLRVIEFGNPENNLLSEYNFYERMEEYCI